jgi:hypothetical protein
MNTLKQSRWYPILCKSKLCCDILAVINSRTGILPVFVICCSGVRSLTATTDRLRDAGESFHRTSLLVVLQGGGSLDWWDGIYSTTRLGRALRIQVAALSYLAAIMVLYYIYWIYFFHWCKSDPCRNHTMDFCLSRDFKIASIILTFTPFLTSPKSCHRA